MLPCLLTSFQPWLSHHHSNSSDDLLALVEADPQRPPNWVFLRQIPVDFDQAPAQVLAAIAIHKPRWVICCGMAETRAYLEVEQYARQGNHCQPTALDTVTLTQGLPHTRLSQDAGTYVCNHLYYQVLTTLPTLPFPCEALFLHVPPLTPTNQAPILQDCLTLLHRLTRPRGTAPSAAEPPIKLGSTPLQPRP